LGRWLEGLVHNDIFDYLNGIWVPLAPVLGIGQSAFVCFVANAYCCTNNLVVNGSFEAPVVANNNYTDVTNLPGWTTTDSQGEFELWAGNFGGISNSADGNQNLELNANDLDETVSQTVTDLSTNCPAEFCFDYTGRNGVVSNTYNNDFTVTLSGGYSMTLQLDPASYAAGGWIGFCTNFTPTSSTVTIAFEGAPHSAANGPGGAHIDNVSLTQCCPSPCPPNTPLHYVTVGSNIVFTWNGANYRLQGSTSIGAGAAWVNIPGNSPVTVPMSSPMRFFRLVCP